MKRFIFILLLFFQLLIVSSCKKDETIADNHSEIFNYENFEFSTNNEFDFLWLKFEAKESSSYLFYFDVTAEDFDLRVGVYEKMNYQEKNENSLFYSYTSASLFSYISQLNKGDTIYFCFYIGSIKPASKGNSQVMKLNLGGISQ